jgi:uncharacterized protein YaaQ
MSGVDLGGPGSTGGEVKLLICVVNREDTDSLVHALIENDYRATVISTIGGFLREGNTTLLLAVPQEQVEDALEVIQANCHTRIAYLNPVPPIPEMGMLSVPVPLEVKVGGAAVFVLDVMRLERI